ncbi:MAG: MCE family protein, partial [Burkholderiales bacterium]|nr:MCE family protein [Burkholderiales bacterium]
MERPALSAPRIPYLRLKVGILLVLVPLIVVGMVLYTLHARGVFEASRTVSLLAADADGVSTGMPVTFSGFPIGRVIRMSLQDDGRVHVEVRIPEKEARWLRTTSVFTLDQPIIGSAKIRVTTPDIAAPPLPAGATVELVKRDATAQLPQILERTDAVLANVEAMTGGDSSLRDTLASLQVLSRRMSGEFGALEGLTGSPERARQVLGTLERADALVASLRQTSRQLEQLTARADQRLFAAGGMADETR